MNGLAVLTDDQNMRVTIKNSGKGALVCGASCFVGGIVAGPVGMAIGGTLGGLKAWHMSRGISNSTRKNNELWTYDDSFFFFFFILSGQFKSVAEVIRYDMTNAQREQLKDYIMAVATEFEITDLAVLLPMLMSNTSIQAAALRTVVSFVTNEMNLQIQNWWARLLAATN